MTQSPGRPGSRSFVGQTLGPWRVVSLIAEGGMGLVYKGRHTTDGREAALKVLSYDYEDENDALSRFFHEARILADLDSPHLVRVYDFVREGAVAAYSMEFLEGEDLARIIVRERTLPPWRVVRIARQVCDAMQAAHDAGVVHRDLKPENVFLVRNGPWPDFVKILDFGIAKYKYLVAHRTALGAQVGSPWYMSPEQALSIAVDGRADMYALGCIMYEILSGRVPFDGPSPSEIARKQANETPAPLAHDYGAGPIPEGLAVIILRCLEKDPKGRFANMRALSESLREYDGDATRRERLPIW